MHLQLADNQHIKAFNPLASSLATFWITTDELKQG
jgi:hypothetical protein